MEARRQSRPEEAEVCPEATKYPEVTKAHQYPLVARPELVKVTKARPESEGPEVVHHHLEMAEPEESEAHRPAFHHHHRPAASLHHRRELLASREPVWAWVAGSDVRPESAWRPPKGPSASHLVVCPEMGVASCVLRSGARLVARPELSGVLVCWVAFQVACCPVALAYPGLPLACPFSSSCDGGEACPSSLFACDGHDDDHDGPPKDDAHDRHPKDDDDHHDRHRITFY